MKKSLIIIAIIDIVLLITAYLLGVLPEAAIAILFFGIGSLVQYYRGKRADKPVGSQIFHVPAQPEPVPEPVKPAEPEPEPMPKNILLELTVVNNQSGEKITYKTENEFGLDWKEYHNNLTITQCYNSNKDSWRALGLFTSHSVTKVRWGIYGEPYDKSAKKLLMDKLTELKAKQETYLAQGGDGEGFSEQINLIRQILFQLKYKNDDDGKSK